MNTKIYISIETGTLVTAQGRAAAPPSLTFTTTPTWTVCLVKSDGSPFDASAAASWRAAVDMDFRSDTAPMARTLADGVDANEAAQGVVKVSLNTNTKTFKAAADGRSHTPAWFELWGMAAGGEILHHFIVPILVRMPLDPVSGEFPGVDVPAVEYVQSVNGLRRAVVLADSQGNPLPADPAAGQIAVPSALSDLSDTSDLSDPPDGAALVYDAALAKWRPGAAQGRGAVGFPNWPKNEQRYTGTEYTAAVDGWIYIYKDHDGVSRIFINGSEFDFMLQTGPSGTSGGQFASNSFLPIKAGTKYKAQIVQAAKVYYFIPCIA